MKFGACISVLEEIAKVVWYWIEECWWFIEAIPWALPFTFANNKLDGWGEIKALNICKNIQDKNFSWIV